ncbi:MAG: hypothetical protein WCG76_02675 [Verrucomicrobiota bacterium]
MKSYASILAAIAGGFAALLALSWMMNHPESPVAVNLLGFGAWLLSEVAPQIHFALAPTLVVAVLVFALVYSVSFPIWWKLEIWSAGLASRVSGQALNSQGGITVEQEMRRLIGRFGRRR